MYRLLFIILLTGAIHSHALAEENAEAETQKRTEVTYSEIRKLVDDGVVEFASITGDGWWVNVTTNDGARHYAQITPQTPIADHLYKAGVSVKIVHWNEKEDEMPLWLKIFYNILPLLIFIVFFVFVLWFSQKRGRKVQDDCLKRAEAINNEFLDRQQVQLNNFIEELAFVLKGKSGE